MTEQGKPWRDKSFLYEQYWRQEKSCYEIAEDIDCTYRTVHTWMEKLGVPRRGRDEAGILAKLKDRVPRFETQDTGYERWVTRHRYEKWQCKVHRLLAVAEYGYDAVCDRHVHHKNGIPWDNRPGNIEVVTTQEHRERHPITERREDGTAVAVGLVGGSDEL